MPDIYSMFTAAMLENLPPQKREFLAVMGLADEFTVEMARVVTEMPDAAEILLTLTEQNAFVTRLPDGKTFRFHHMLKECARAAVCPPGSEKSRMPAGNGTGRGMRQSSSISTPLTALRGLQRLRCSAAGH